MPHPVFRPALLSLGLLAACADGPVDEAAALPEPVVEASPVLTEPSPTSVTSRSGPGLVRTGVITAGDIDDALNFAAFSRYASKAQRSTGLPRVSLQKPILLQLTGPTGKPAPGMRFTIKRKGHAEPFYDGYSGVDGMISVLPATYDVRPGAMELTVFPDDNSTPNSYPVSGSHQRSRLMIGYESDWTPDFLDLVFVVDTTGSMADELNWLTAELKSILRSAKRKAPGVDIRYGLVVYRDDGDEYVVRNFGFTKRQSKMISWLRAQHAAGGGDYPEAASRALAAGAALPWRRGKGERLMFHIADAPPHDHAAKAYLSAAGTAAENGVQIFGLGASGVADEAEFLMRQASVMTGGRYLFLTDDSGVGYGHAEPKISCYRVTSLKDLVTRVLASELSGRRVEASKTIREVGSYRRGLCLN